MMSISIIKIIFISYLCILCQCTIGASIPPPVNPTTANLQCIAQAGYKLASQFVSSTTKGIKQKVADQLLMIKNTGMEAQLVLTPCKVLTPVDEVKFFVNRIPKNYCDKVWLFPPGEVTEPACDWSSDNPDQNCKLLLQFLEEFKKSGWDVGVLANQEIYDEYYGKCEGLSQYPLFWAPEDLDYDESFANYKPFGGWLKPAKKLLDGEFVCKVPFLKIYQP